METRSPPWLRQWSLFLFHVPPFSKNVYKRFSKEGFGHTTNERNNDNNINENDINNNIGKDVANDNNSLNYRNNNDNDTNDESNNDDDHSQR